jgi:hypothetical protein
VSLRQWMGEPFKAEAHLMTVLAFGPLLLALIGALLVMLYVSRCSPAP